MSQNYIVFTETKKLFIGSYEHHPCGIKFKKKDLHSKHLWDFIQNQPDDELFLDIDFKSFSKASKFIKAAGGIVCHEDSLLMIYRNGVWDLPKGWIEAGEFPMQAALREVIEECGDLDLTIENLSPIITYHIYPLKSKWALKETHWFPMSVKPPMNLKPQKSEGIQKAAFIPLEELEGYFKKSYPLMKFLWDSFQQSH